MPTPTVQPILVTCQAVSSAETLWLGIKPETWVTALVSLIVGIFAISVAWSQRGIAATQRDIADQQRRIAEERIILDLFDRRFQIFDAVTDAVHSALIITTAYDEVMQKLSRASDQVRKSRFLMGEDVYDLLQRAVALSIRHAVAMKHVDRLMGLTATREIEILAERHTKDAQEAFSELNGKIVPAFPDLFRPYLSIRDFRNGS